MSIAEQRRRAVLLRHRGRVPDSQPKAEHCSRHRLFNPRCRDCQRRATE